MKKYFYILLSLLLATGCNFLDFDETDGKTVPREVLYSTYSNIQKMLTNVYGYMPHKDIADVGSAMRECGSDDAEYGDPDSSVQRFNNGNWSAVSTVDTKWDLFGAIRSANEFLESIQTVDLSMYKNDGDFDKWDLHLKYYPYEAMALRAFYLFELARRYGDVPIPEGMLTIEEANSIKRSPFDEVIDYLVEDCDTCALHLPDTYIGMLGDEYGRVTCSFAMALKTRALLYAASPLFNPNGDKAKWKRAALAAKELMDYSKSKNDLFSLVPGDKANTVQSPETIFQIMRSASQSFEKYNFPVRFTEGQRTSMSGTYPTQDLVDAFQTLGGYDITLEADGWHTDDPSFDITNPYEGRDPRFARAVLADGAEFKGSVIETFVGGADYSATRNDLGTPTGYYLNKYIQQTTSFEKENSMPSKHSWIVFRYAEIILSYAEAVNEYLDGPDATDATFPMSAREALNMIRANAGMPDIPESISSKEDFRKAVQREWRVEFAFEDHRFWDIRRWKIGAQTQTSISGVRIVKDESDQKTYSRFTVEDRVWADRMYLYPIPQEELFKNPHLGQNPEW